MASPGLCTEDNSSSLGHCRLFVFDPSWARQAKTEELGGVLPDLTPPPSPVFVLSGLKLSFHLGWGPPSQSQTFPVGSVSQVLT